MWSHIVLNHSLKIHIPISFSDCSEICPVQPLLFWGSFPRYAYNFVCWYKIHSGKQQTYIIPVPNKLIMTLALSLMTIWPGISVAHLNFNCHLLTLTHEFFKFFKQFAYLKAIVYHWLLSRHCHAQNWQHIVNPTCVDKWYMAITKLYSSSPFW